MRFITFALSIATFALSTANSAYALIGVNQCGPGTRPPIGMHCGHDELLLGYRNASGACVWVCCPPNSDGKTYNCSAEPTPSDLKLDLSKVRAKPWKPVFTPGREFEKTDEGK